MFKNTWIFQMINALFDKSKNILYLLRLSYKIFREAGVGQCRAKNVIHLICNSNSTKSRKFWNNEKRYIYLKRVY